MKPPVAEKVLLGGVKTSEPVAREHKAAAATPAAVVAPAPPSSSVWDNSVRERIGDARGTALPAP